MLEERWRDGPDGIPAPARGPVGIPAEGPVGMEDVEGTVGTDGEAGAGRLTGSAPLDGLEEKSLVGRLGAAPQLVVSGRVWRS
jgi:hypothetical protein